MAVRRSTEEKTAALQHYRTLLLEHLQAQLEKSGGSWVLDGADIQAVVYQEQIAQVENWYRQRRLDSLERRWKDLAPRASESPTEDRPESKGWSRTISQSEEEGIIKGSVLLSTGPEPAHFRAEEVPAPDGQRRLLVTHRDYPGNPYTDITLFFPAASGSIFTCTGIHPVQAHWPDNHTVVITYPEGAIPHVLHQEVSSFGDRIIIHHQSSRPGA